MNLVKHILLEFEKLLQNFSPSNVYPDFAIANALSRCVFVDSYAYFNRFYLSISEGIGLHHPATFKWLTP